MDFKSYLALLVLLAIVMFPRFDRLDRFGIDAFTTKGKPASVYLADAGKYINHVRYFRGEVDHGALRAPWAYRPLPVFLASQLPFKPITAINVTNYIFLSIGLFFLLRTLVHLNLNTMTIRLGGLGFVLSFPVFFYGGIGYIDPVLVGMLCIGQYLILKSKNILFFGLLGLGALVKDPYIIILPAWATFQIASPNANWFRTVAISICALIMFAIIIYLVRNLTPVDSNFFWSPQQRYLDFNLYRKNSWITWMITFGPIGLAAIWFCLKKIKSIFRDAALFSFAAGLAGSIAVLIYAYFSVFVDGRYIWIAYPFMIPLACIYWETDLRKKNAKHAF